ncbi:hypothetical protein C7M84_007953 [Penaeus vannamei]|uniref:Protein MMS22-like n=1 Tax=Penaeus vannamei TaxID=6689 RepID=A0A423TB31_PENVA|nr:protein MMS22-like [Penaeus vannamei]ROT73627.1 hypothetical protein C7M84_007953 [Penaeus vannamei]
MSGTAVSMTPPLTPPVEGTGEEVMDSDSLDYMDFFINDMELSPVKEEKATVSVLNEGPVLFSCSGEVRWSDSFDDTSCIGRRCLANLLQFKNPCSDALLAPEIVFHLPCTADNLHYRLDHFFLATRQGVTELERGAQSSLCVSQSCYDIQYPKIRKDITTFFNSLVSYVYSQSGDEHREFLLQVVTEVLETLLFLGPLHELPEHVTSASSPQGNKCPSAAYHLLHLHLDIRWWSVALLHLAEATLGSLSAVTAQPHAPQMLIMEPSGPQGMSGSVGDNTEPSVLEQCISMVVWDLVTIMCREGLKKSVSELHLVAGFSCSCSLELGIMILHYLDHRHRSLGRQSLWEQIKHKLLVLLKIYNENSVQRTSPGTTLKSLEPSEQAFGVIQYPSPLAKEVKLPHIWWMFLNFSRLYGYDVNGKKLADKSSEIKSETKLLRTLIKLSMEGQQPTEIELRFFTRCCLSLGQLWGGERSSEWGAALWDYFSKHLDSSFLLPGAGLDGLACVSKTASGWIEQIKSYATDPTHMGKSESSWQIFLRIIVSVVKTSTLEWRQMRGRIYSKFHGRKMSELSPIGLHNSTSLFLTLASTTDIVDVSNKLSELLSMVPASSLGKSKIVWRGFLATILLLLGAGCDISPVIGKLKPIIANVLHELGTTRDAMQRRDLGQLVVIYADGLQEVFEQSHDLSLAQHSLISVGLGAILHHCGAVEMKAILNALDAALTKVLAVLSKPQYLAGGLGTDIVEVVWKEFGVFLRNHATTLTPPAVLGSVAAKLTLCMSYDFNSATSGLKEAASGLFSYFVTNEAVSTTCSLQYITSLLAEPGSLTQIDKVNTGYEGLLVSGWLTTLVTMGDSDEVISLTPLIMTLPGVASIISCSPPACPFAAARLLVKGVSRKFSESQKFMDRMAIRERALQYFSGLDKPISALLKKTPLPNHLRDVLELIADLFFYGHSVIYIKSRPTCPLPVLVSSVLLPTTIYSCEKPLNASLSTALGSTIPKMVCGLGSLGLAQDPYLVRCVRDVFNHYMYRFPVKTTKNYTTVTHPFIMCLHDADVREEVIQELRQVFLEVVRDSYFGKRGISNLHLQVVISLVLELMSRSAMEWQESVCTYLLFPLLELLLNLEDQTTKRIATDLLQKLLQGAQEQDVPSRNELVKSIRQLVFQHVSWSSSRLFRVLGVVGVLHRPLLVDSLPHIARAVTATEEKRGTGLDHTLRQGYQSLLSSLGVNEGDIHSSS